MTLNLFVHLNLQNKQLLLLGFNSGSKLTGTRGPEALLSTFSDSHDTLLSHSGTQYLVSYGHSKF